MRPIELMVEAIEKELPHLSTSLTSGGMRLLVTDPEAPLPAMVDFTLRYDDDIDEVVCWLTSNVELLAKKLPLVSMTSIISDATDLLTDPDRDRGPYPAPSYEPTSLRGLPPEIRESVVRAVIYRFALRGSIGIKLRERVAEQLSEEIPESEFKEHVSAIARAIHQTAPEEREMADHFDIQFLADVAAKLYETGEFSKVHGIMRLKHQIRTGDKSPAPTKSRSKFADWTEEERETYISEGTKPVRQPASVH